ncbi:hypothetical protein K8O68_03710 [Salipaludibacillus sp. CUR1]|uniref:Uncharacterized protein n=1 Tax=Salipaludibacillus aurantiacus TaxID=1601833 RepID=A0A1H9S440_9BACI|nr:MULTISPECIES: hypothetical protein [Salipaludibacillus]MCE7791531.1 hypothetical protein [Salipaludibacillus sp. CUR1]SER79751.1 hypothetical protein SAMN05518684_10416 [Salipaludibacillus aurantiacus]
MSLTDINAHKKWRKVPANIRNKLINNVFCPDCFNTTIVNYDLKTLKNGLLLEGDCKQCGKSVARVIEDE